MRLGPGVIRANTVVLYEFLHKNEAIGSAIFRPGTRSYDLHNVITTRFFAHILLSRKTMV